MILWFVPVINNTESTRHLNRETPQRLNCSTQRGAAEPHVSKAGPQRCSWQWKQLPWRQEERPTKGITNKQSQCQGAWSWIMQGAAPALCWSPGSTEQAPLSLLCCTWCPVRCLELLAINNTKQTNKQKIKTKFQKGAAAINGIKAPKLNGSPCLCCKTGFCWCCFLAFSS